MTIAQQLTSLPDSPGIYQFYNAQKKLIYVGKATSLKQRVRSYFLGKRTMRPIEQMIHQIKTIAYIETDSVLEAIILEANTIKRYLPEYNVEGKDDKTWNYILITKDDYPQIKTLRQHQFSQLRESQIKKQFSHIFGPYPGLQTKAALRLLQKMFSFSTCTPGAKRPCFYYQMGECLGVCIGHITPKDYKQKVIRPLITFLSGRKKILIKQLESNMKNASKQGAFEEAARLRDQIYALQRIQDIALLNKSFVEEKKAETRKWKREISRVEGYDISNLGKSGKVGSMVVFEYGEPKKSDYRKFTIRTVEGQSDVDCLEEVLRRRLKHREWPLPQIFLIDGGMPQVNRTKKVFKENNIRIPIVGIAKGPQRKKNEFRIDFGLLTSDSHKAESASRRNKQQLIHWVSQHKQLLIQVRDEAHRFAITFQRQRRRLTMRRG